MAIDLTPSIELILNFMKEGALVFFLVFGLVYFILEKVQIFTVKDGEKTEANRKINMMIAFALATASIIPHFTNTYYGGYGSTIDVVEIVNTALPSVTLLILGIFMAIVLMSIFGVGVSSSNGFFKGIVIFGSLLAVLYIFLTSAGIMVSWQYFSWLDEELGNFILTVLVMVLGIWMIIGSPVDDSVKAAKAWKDIKEALK